LYSHIPKVVCEQEDIMVLWNQGVQTDMFWLVGGIIIKNKTSEVCLLIDVAIPRDRNIMKKEAEKK